MNEDYLQYCWKENWYDQTTLTTTSGISLKVLYPGEINVDAGPDFIAALIEIDGVMMVGHVEIHQKSSDWDHHGHQFDERYNNVILHVVREHDREVKLESGEQPLILEFGRLLWEHGDMLYRQQLAMESKLPCEHRLLTLPKIALEHWFVELLRHRMDRKVGVLKEQLSIKERDWQSIFYRLLASGMGMKVNVLPFEMLTEVLPFKLLLKHRDRPFQCEALLFGQAGFLNDNFVDTYPTMLKREYLFLKKKYCLKGLNPSIWKFSRMRPAGFPTVRIAMFAALIPKIPSIRVHVESGLELSELLRYFDVKPHSYWKNHYRFDRLSSKQEDRGFSQRLLVHLVVNVLAPYVLLLESESGAKGSWKQAKTWMSSLPAEENKVIRQWKAWGVKPRNALQSQALLELKNEFCSREKCLNCRLGASLNYHESHVQPHPRLF